MQTEVDRRNEEKRREEKSGNEPLENNERLRTTDQILIFATQQRCYVPTPSVAETEFNYSPQVFLYYHLSYQLCARKYCLLLSVQKHLPFPFFTFLSVCCILPLEYFSIELFLSQMKAYRRTPNQKHYVGEFHSLDDESSSVNLINWITSTSESNLKPLKQD